ncbi:MAG TPA: catalase family protein [Aliidongia sp.]|uniref:catalase family protein n=1 Tax=Aliidongia sp. TaxID=1914230 RepID=UPI002DDD7438|nr:catalase family protein [Aliidongia sp.]HEV2677469.1 catalase family protein [Aliidongia sp.]
MSWQHRVHAALLCLLHLERRIDPFFRPAFDALFREPLAAITQAIIVARGGPEPLEPARETMLPDEAACLRAITDSMSHYMRAQYAPGGYQRAGNTKTHGMVRGRFIVRADLPPALRHGLFAMPGEYPAWVRFAGPGPASPPDIDDIGVLSIGLKVMGVPGPKLLADERFTQDFTGISTPTFTTPDVHENRKLQAAIGRGLPLFYFIDPRDFHLLDGIMQGLWARTQTSPLETEYWSCVPYLLGHGQAMRYGLRPQHWGRSRVPDLPGRPPDDYLRQAMAATLAKREVAFDFRIQLQTDPRRMPIENASVRWPEHLSRPITAATLLLPRQVFDTPAQLAFASRFSINPWHCLPEHRPLGNQNRARRAIYEELSRLRQVMNGTPHVEPTGDETFD